MGLQVFLRANNVYDYVTSDGASFHAYVRQATGNAVLPTELRSVDCTEKSRDNCRTEVPPTRLIDNALPTSCRVLWRNTADTPENEDGDGYRSQPIGVQTSLK